MRYLLAQKEWKKPWDAKLEYRGAVREYKKSNEFRQLNIEPDSQYLPLERVA